MPLKQAEINGQLICHRNKTFIYFTVYYAASDLLEIVAFIVVKQEGDLMLVMACAR